MQFEPQRGVLRDFGQSLQPIDVVGLGVLALAKHHNGTEFRTMASGPLEGFRLAATFSHRWSADQPERSKELCLIHLGKRAETTMQIGVLQVL